MQRVGMIARPHPDGCANSCRKSVVIRVGLPTLENQLTFLREMGPEYDGSLLNSLYDTALKNILQGQQKEDLSSLDIPTQKALLDIKAIYEQKVLIIPLILTTLKP